MKRSGAGAGAAARAKARRDLVALLDEVDDEGLAFLTRQARVIVHNLEVERLNTEVAQRGARAAAGPNAPAVVIEEGAAGTTFVVAIGGARKVFGLDEMRALTRVAQAAPSDAEGARRLHTWLARNRSDVLADLGARSGAHPLLVEMHRAIRRRHRPRAPKR